MEKITKFINDPTGNITLSDDDIKKASDATNAIVSKYSKAAKTLESVSHSMKTIEIEHERTTENQQDSRNFKPLHDKLEQQSKKFNKKLSAEKDFSKHKKMISDFGKVQEKTINDFFCDRAKKRDEDYAKTLKEIEEDDNHFHDKMSNIVKMISFISTNPSSGSADEITKMTEILRKARTSTISKESMLNALDLAESTLLKSVSAPNQTKKS